MELLIASFALAAMLLAGWLVIERRRGRDTQAQYQLLFEENPLPFWVFHRDTLRILEANAAAVSQYGYTREEFKRMSSRTDGGGSRSIVPPTPREQLAAPVATSQQRTTYDRAPGSMREPPPPLPPAPPPPSPPRPQAPSHGATRFSSVFGTRRR